MIRDKIFNKDKKDKVSSVKEWLPIKDIIKGIIVLKNNHYVKILELSSVNFKLKSELEKKAIIMNYASFLKACRFPMQICVQCRRASVETHVRRMDEYIQKEKNKEVKLLMRGYADMVNSLAVKGAVSRKFFVVFPYEAPLGQQDISFENVYKQFSEKEAMIKAYLKPCGNQVVDISFDTEYCANVLYTYFCRKSSQAHPYKDAGRVYIKSEEGDAIAF